MACFGGQYIKDIVIAACSSHIVILVAGMCSFLKSYCCTCSNVSFIIIVMLCEVNIQIFDVNKAFAGKMGF